MQRIVAQTLFRFQQHVKLILVFWSAVNLASCTTIPAPVEEYAVARAALEAARLVDAARFAGPQFHRGMETYLRAEILFRNREYHEARDLFDDARESFEKSENMANVQRKKNGETL